MKHPRRFGTALGSYLRKVDFFLLGVALVCSGIGMVLIYSVGSGREMLVQGLAIGLGLMAFVLLTFIDLEQLSHLWKGVLVFNLVLLLLPLFFGEGAEETGNNSWIRFNITSTFQLGFQPGEIGKIIYIFTLAKHMKILESNINSFRGLLALGLHAIVPVAMVLFFSDDDGMATSYLFIFVVMAFAAGIDWKICAAGIATFLAAIPALWFFVFGQYQKDRFIVLFDSNYKTDTVGYHQIQSLAAIRSGGFWGDGYRQGSICQKGYLPSDHTDFIFCVACEEFGFFGGLVILILLTTLILSCVVSGVKMKNDRFALLCSVGIGAMFTYQTFINVGMCLKVAPVIGLTLPFISYGGTSVVTMYVAIGIVASLKAHYIPGAYARNLYDY